MDTPIYDNLPRDEYDPSLDEVDVTDGGLDDVEYGDEITTAGLIARSRKAIVAGAVGFAGALAPLVLSATADGVFNLQGEGIPALIISLGVGASALLVTWAVPNAK